MITKEQASALWKQKAPKAWPDDKPLHHTEPRDLGDCWYLGFQGGAVGSMGLIVDKSDGHMNWLGSAHTWDTWLYAHRCGFSHHRRYVWSISDLKEPERLATLLRRMGYQVRLIDFTQPIITLSFRWIEYELLRDIAAAGWMSSSFTVAECDWSGCSRIGSRIPDFSHVKYGDTPV